MDNMLITYLRQLIENEQTNIENYTLEVYKLQQLIAQIDNKISTKNKEKNDKYLFSPNKPVSSNSVSFELVDEKNSLSAELLSYQEKIDNSKKSIIELKNVISDYKTFVKYSDIEKKYNDASNALKIINDKAKLCSQIINVDPVRSLVELKEIINLSSN